MESFHHNLSPTSTCTGFTLPQLQEAQRYPLLFLFPWPLPLLQQGIFIALLLVALGSLIAYLRNSSNKGVSCTLALAELARSLIGPLADALVPIADDLFYSARSISGAMVACVPSVGLGSSFHRSLGQSSKSADSTSTSGTRKQGVLRRAVATPASSAFNGLASSSSGVSAQLAEGEHHPGLRNTGNTCYFNSVLQSLASLPRLYDWLQHLESQAERWDVPTPVADALMQLILELNTPLKHRRALLPNQLTAALQAAPDSMAVRALVGAHAQQDAHELFVLLLSALSDEAQSIDEEASLQIKDRTSGLRGLMAPTLKMWALGTSNGSTSGGCSSTREAAEAGPSKPNPFRGLAAQRTACYTCGYVEAVRHTTFEELNLTVPTYRACNLRDCLANWTEIEHVDWICWRCTLHATRSRVRDEVGRLEAAAESSKAGKKAPLNATKKRRLKEAKRQLARVERAILHGEHEDEFLDSSNGVSCADAGDAMLPLVSGAEIRLERTMSRAATKQVMLARPPPVLAIHLNRSSYSAASFGASKNDALVRFPEHLDVGDFTTDGKLSVKADEPISQRFGSSRRVYGDVDEEGDATWSIKGTRDANGHTTNGQNGHTSGYHLNGKSRQSALAYETPQTIYRLQSLVVHYGGHSFGHYVSYRRRPRRRAQDGNPRQAGAEDDLGSSQQPSRRAFDQTGWLRISDGSVEACHVDEALSQNPFLLFYERIDASDPPRLDSTHEATRLSDPASQQSRRTPTGFEAFRGTQSDRHRRLLSPRIVHSWSTATSLASSPLATPDPEAVHEQRGLERTVEESSTDGQRSVPSTLASQDVPHSSSGSATLA